MEPRRPPNLWLGVPLFLIALVGIFFFSRGVAYFTHHRSATTGATFLCLGLVCYGASFALMRWLRRRRDG